VAGELRVDDPAVVVALYDPLRYRIFRLLAAPHTVAELADEVGMPANRLYYHVRRLVECGLVQQVDARVSGRHTERVYGRTAERIRFAGDLDLYEGGLLRGITDELDEWLREARDEDAASVSFHTPTLAPETARELETRLRDLIAEYADRKEPGRRYGVLGVLAPAEEQQ
jgi:DNA-binding transcriptional ArsR family regulator